MAASDGVDFGTISMIAQQIKDAYYGVALLASKLLRPLYAVHYRARRRDVTRVHIGCGANYISGFINIDGNVYRRVDYVLDIRAGLPFPDASIEFIYSCHMLEHIYINDAIAALGEWRRVLRAGGYIRLAVPDFAYALRILAGEVESKFPRAFRSWEAQAANFIFCDGQHKFVYSKSIIDEISAAVGFARVEWAGVTDKNLPLLDEPVGSVVVNIFK